MRRRLFGGRGDGSHVGRHRPSPYPIRTCHFCTLPSTVVPPHPSSSSSSSSSSSNDQDGSGGGDDDLISTKSLPLSTGSVDNWFCSQCKCWNRIDAHEEGGMASWEQGMAAGVGDEKIKPALVAPLTNSLIARHSTADPAFCHVCQTNQMLLLSMSANYDGDKGVDDEAEQWRRYQAWRDDLEERYPPVCTDCQETVEGRIHVADQRARALIWNDLLRKRQQERIAQQHPSPLRSNVTSLAASSPPAAVVASTQASVSPYHEQPIATFFTTAWHAGAACFVLSWAAEALLTVSVSDATDRRAYQMFALAVLHCGSLQWDPSVVRQLALAKQRRDIRRVRITGMAQWRNALYVLAGLRLTHIASRWSLAVVLLDSGPVTALITSLSFFALEVGLCMRAYVRVGVESPTRISLKSRSSLQTTSQRRNNGLDLNMLTLDHSVNRRSDSRDVSEEEVEHDVAEDSMDWSPTMPANDASSSFQLGPQRFFEPAKQTGLEELLASRLDLGHDRAKPVQHTPHSNRQTSATSAKPMRIAAFVLVMLVVGSTATAILASSSSPPTTALWTAVYTLRDCLITPWQAWWQRAQLLASHDNGGIWDAHAAAARAQRQPAMY